MPQWILFFCWEAAISVYVVLSSSSSGLRETFRVGRLHRFWRRKSERILIVFLLLKSGGGGDFVPPPRPGGRGGGGSSPPPKKRGKGGGGGGRGNVFQQVWTCFNRFERVSTGSNGLIWTDWNVFRQVSTGLNVFQQVWTDYSMLSVFFAIITTQLKSIYFS